MIAIMGSGGDLELSREELPTIIQRLGMAAWTS